MPANKMLLSLIVPATTTTKVSIAPALANAHPAADGPSVKHVRNCPREDCRCGQPVRNKGKGPAVDHLNRRVRFADLPQPVRASPSPPHQPRESLRREASQWSAFWEPVSAASGPSTSREEGSSQGKSSSCGVSVPLDESFSEESASQEEFLGTSSPQGVSIPQSPGGSLPHDLSHSHGGLGGPSSAHGGPSRSYGQQSRSPRGYSKAREEMIRQFLDSRLRSGDEKGETVYLYDKDDDLNYDYLEDVDWVAEAKEKEEYERKKAIQSKKEKEAEEMGCVFMMEEL